MRREDIDPHLPPPERSRSRLSEVIDTRHRAAMDIDPIEPNEVSIVVPVRDNQAGIDRFLMAIQESVAPLTRPREVIIVDNMSSVPTTIPRAIESREVDVLLLRCEVPGAAAARNVGVNAARGSWILFSDSDCIPTPSLIHGYCSSAEPGIVAYAGHVSGTPQGRLTRFYDEEGILLPYTKKAPSGVTAPLYIVTANALVWKPAFQAAGGFDQRFRNAGGEDVELSIRLWKVGGLAINRASVVEHDFSDGHRGFWSRFVRYGVGNYSLECVTGATMRPRLRLPKTRRPYNVAAKVIQHLALCTGYFGEYARDRWRTSRETSV
jgi:glycosyltransferase involved in cell wall biosynthesis